ncbi:MAG: hypothetical protein KKG04_00145 [Candidatus Thermoplasmatota archaeon]|nr:hypothetical protein [Candidatus Thermoplasmatota archaeon]
MKDKKLVVVTGNTTKFKEIAKILERHQIAVIRVDFDIAEIRDQDLESVVVDKVKKAYSQVCGPVVVDDSGIFFDEYNQFPGSFTKFLFQSVGYNGIFKLVSEGSPAHFHSYVAYFDDLLNKPVVFQGEYPGKIIEDFKRDQENEMPYAPMFIPFDSDKPMALMTSEERKNDHRHKAFDAFAEWYKEYKRSE